MLRTTVFGVCALFFAAACSGSSGTDESDYDLRAEEEACAMPPRVAVEPPYEDLAMGEGDVSWHSIATDGTTIYWMSEPAIGAADAAPDRLMSYSIATGEVAVVAELERGASGVATDSGPYIYAFERAGSVLQIAKDGGAITPIADGPVDSLALDADAVYLLYGGGVLACAGRGTIRVVSRTTGTVASLVENAGCLRDLAVDNSHVYFTERSFQGTGGSIQRVRKDGSGAATLVRAPIGFTPLALSDSHIYFFVDGGDLASQTLARVAKEGSDVERLSGPCMIPVSMAVRGERLLVDNAGWYAAMHEDGTGAVSFGFGRDLPGGFVVVGSEIYEATMLEPRLVRRSLPEGL